MQPEIHADEGPGPPTRTQGARSDLFPVAGRGAPSPVGGKGGYVRDTRESADGVDGDTVSGNGSGSSVEPRMMAPPSGTLVYGRILKRTTLIPCYRNDKPLQLIETLLKESKRSSSIGVDQIVAVINLLKPAKVLKMKSPVMRHKHVQLYDTLWMVTIREWNYFLKWLKKAGRTPTRHGKEVEHANPSQLNEEELRLFITKFDYDLSDEDKERAETAFLTHHNFNSYPQTPKLIQTKSSDNDIDDGDGHMGDDDEDGDREDQEQEGQNLDVGEGEDEDGEEYEDRDEEHDFDMKAQLIDITPQTSKNMKTPPTMANLKQRTEKKDQAKTGNKESKQEGRQKRDPHLSSLHDDVDPLSLHSSRIKKPYAQGIFVEGPKPASPPSPPRPVTTDTSATAQIHGAKKVAFQSPRNDEEVAGGAGSTSQEQEQGQRQRLNPHFFGHPLDLKTPHHMRRNAGAGAGAGAEAGAEAGAAGSDGGEGGEGDYSGESSLMSASTDADKIAEDLTEGIKIDLFPGSGSAGKILSDRKPQKRYSIATSTPDAFRAPFVPTVQTSIPIGEEDIHDHDHDHESGADQGVEAGIKTDGDEKGNDVGQESQGLDSVSSTPDPELQELMKGQLAVAESRARQEAEAKKHAQSQLEAALREKDQHLERLEDADRVRISLEGRLQETRTMLQILSARDNDVGGLEKALSTISTDALNVPEARGASPYPSVGSANSSESSSRLGTPAEMRDDVEIPIRKLSGNGRRRGNVVISGQASSPLLSQRELAEASREVGGSDNVLLDMVTERGGEELRLARAHAEEHDYVAATEMNEEEQERDQEEEALRAKFLVAQDPPSDVAFDIKGVKGRDVWDTHSNKELLEAAPKDLEERLGKIDTRFLTVKEKLFRPFLRVHKGTGRKLFTEPAVVQGAQQTQWEICVWTIFQIFGRAGAGDSAIVRFITQLQINRALKEAGISADMQGKLELSLTKMRSGAMKVGAARAEAKAKMKKKKAGPGAGQPAGGSTGGGGKAEFGFSFSEFLVAMSMLVTMIRDVRYKVGGRGGRLGASRGVMADVAASKALAPDRATSLAGEVRDDAWEVVRSQLQERFIQICAGERGSAQPIINSKLEDSTRSLACLSGVISSDSPYLASFPSIMPGQTTDIVVSLAEIVKAPLSKDYDACRHTWDRNAETVKTLYASYASQLEPRPHLPDNVTVGAATTSGTPGDDLAAIFASQYQDSAGTSRAGAELMLTFDNLRSMLVDFQIFPQHIDFQSLARIYRSVKVWEWAWCDTLGIKYNKIEAFRLCEVDPLSFAVGSGNMCLTLCGFIEVMTRISHLGCDFSADENGVGETLTYLLRLMNESHGRQMLLSGKRRSVSMRPFAVS